MLLATLILNVKLSTYILILDNTSMEGKEDLTISNPAVAAIKEIEEAKCQPSRSLTQFQMIVVVAFAFFGNALTYFSRLSISGFFLEFLASEELNKTFGNLYS